MKHRWLRVLIAALLIVCGMITLNLWRESISRSEREKAYDRMLNAYRSALEHANSRREVETYLDAHATHFEQSLGVDNERSAWSDLVHIGSGPELWLLQQK